MAHRSTFAAYENLAALCFAMRFLELGTTERDAVFCANAERLFDRIDVSGR